jgi:tetratricopeptide (TPR) repeat protein
MAVDRARTRLVAITAVFAGFVLTALYLKSVIDGSSASSAHSQLLAAFTDGRPIEGRLSGLPYQGLQVPLRNGDLRPPALPLQAAIARATQAAATDPSVANLRALAIANLARGKLDDAVRLLEQLKLDDADGSIASDLAAVYAARARASDRREDFGRALAAAQRALRANPALGEALFNRALALEGVLLGPAAERAWREFLEFEPLGGWAAEARNHLESVDLLQVIPQRRPSSRP